MTSNVASRFLPRTPAGLAGLAICLLGISSIVSGCADRDKKPASLDIAVRPQLTDDDEWLRQQRAVHVKWTSQFGVKEYEASALEVSVLAGAGCDDSAADWPGDSQCEADFHTAHVYACAARNLMAIATAQSDPVQLGKGAVDTFVFDHVTEANVARLTTYAAEFARHAVGLSVRQLQTPSLDCRDQSGVWTLVPSTLRPVSLDFAATAVEAYYIALGATERSVEATLDVSDKARSSTPSASQQRQRAILGMEFSRATAAHMLVGGDDGLLGSTTEGYCLAQSLTPQGRAALQLLRDAAPPLSLLNNSDINVLLNSDQPNTTCPECGGSVRQRLGKFYGLTTMQGVAGTAVDTYYDLTQKNFTEARDYLLQEMSVFNRSPWARLDPSPDATGYSRYAGTAGDRVLELPAGAWAARARYISAQSPWYNAYSCEHFIDPHDAVSDVGFYESPASPRPAPLETLIAGMHGAARNILKSTDNFAGTSTAPVPSPESNEVRGILASVLTSGDYKGTVEMYGNSGYISSYAHGYRASDKVRIMVGEDGLRCATEKSIEGAPCADALTGAQYNAPLPAACTAKPATFSCLTAQVLTTDNVAGWYGTDGYTGGSARTDFVAAPALAAAKTRLYFVKLKDPSLPEAPGNYELLGGAPLLLNLWTAIPVIPWMNDRVASILAPNRKNCAVPRVNCMGKDYDARLPLEDELTSDGDNVENSWKHYLDLARQAANESDLLGREFRDAKLNQLQDLALQTQRQQEQLQASDAALDEVQALCGTAIDNRKLLEYFSGSDGTTNLDFMITPGTCSVSAPCTGDSVCMAGKCIRSPDKLTAPGSQLANDPDAQRLVDCLATGPASVQKFITLGSQELCVYSTTGRPNDVVCPSSLPAGTTCPVPKPSTGCPNPGAGIDTNIAKPLGYFSTPSIGGSGGTDNICPTFRKARKSRSNAWTGADGTATALNLVANSVVFLPGRLSDTVGRPGFVAKYGGHFDVTEDGAPRWSSGNVVQGRTSTEWPHKLPSDCVAGVHDGLFCTVWPSAPTNAQIADLNRRVFEATLAASAIRGSMDSAKLGLDVTYPHPNAWPTTAPTTTTLYLSSVPILRESKSAVLEKGKRGFATAYTWLQPQPEIPAWIAPDGSTLSPSGLYFYGPLDASDAQFAGLSFQPTLIDPYRGNRGYHGFTWVVETLGGQHAEDQGNAIKLNNHEGVVLRNLRPGQPLGGNENFISTRALLDGYEMLCELDRAHNAANVKPASLAPDQWTLSDMSQASAFLKNVAESLESNASRAIFANVPVTAALALNDAPPSGGLSTIGGEMGSAISDLRAGFIEVKEAMPVITSQLQQMSSQVETLKAQLDTVEASKDITELQAWSTSMNAITDCAASLNATAILSFGLNQAAKCANAMAQTAIALKRASLEDRIQENTATIARQQFAEAMAQHAETMQVAALRLETAIERISGVLTSIDGSRKLAARALAKSLYLASYQSTSQRTYDSAVGALSDVAQTRYIRAAKNAKIMSFYARRAIEQRLGIDLSEMRDDLPLVDAPQSWEGEVCTLSGIQPEAGTTPDAEATANGSWVATYGDGFIGEYVDKLEKVVESYRLVNNFHEGRDVAVVSLRDDVANVRTDCLRPSRNLFKDSADLNRWTGMNCNPITTGGVTYSALNCVQALRTPDYVPTTVPASTQKIADLAVKGLRGAEPGAPGFKLQFGDGGTCAAATGGCGWKNGSALSQIVNLSPGKYRLSWYTRDTAACTTTAQCASGFACTNNLCLPSPSYTNGASAGIVIVRGYTNASGVTTPTPAAPSGFVAPQADRSAGARWMRASVEFSITVSGDYEIGFGVGQATMPTVAQEVTIGGPMLETLPPNGTPTMMTSFQPTDSAGMTTLTACEDTNGLRFRREHWSRQCVHLCDDGFTGNCQKGPEYCYQEFTFGVAQPWIATGKLFKYSGFARGNYNYRIDSLALNFVGSKTRDCTDSALPSTCYNAGFIPYSIAHGGPFFIRNQAGDDVEAMLFDGKIEHARGLALERYITNPISSTDRELLSDYMRSEFAGRPLDGTFTVRMWEEPGVDLESVDDIQLILNYRYWTGFD
jgi:hypothetical protein